MRFLRLLMLLSVMLVVGLCGVGAAQAATDAVAARQAPTCNEEARTPLRELVDAADAVVIGKVDTVSPELQASRFEVDVAEVRKAPEGAGWDKQVTVRTPRGDCRLTGVRRGDDWVFVGQVDKEDRLVVTSVGGSQQLTPAVQSRIERLTAGAAPEPPAPELELVADSDPPEFTRLALPGAVLVGVGLLAWLLARALGRPRER